MKKTLFFLVKLDFCSRVCACVSVSVSMSAFESVYVCVYRKSKFDRAPNIYCNCCGFPETVIKIISH